MNGQYHNFLSPLNKNYKWHGGFQLRHLQTCAEMIEEHERLRGKKYSHVAFTRPDNFFLVPHPPMEKLGTPTKYGRCFIPDLGFGALGDYLTDTGATCDRQGAAAYMALGKLVAKFPHKLKCTDLNFCTSEDLLKCGLRWQIAHIVSVQPLFYLTCTPAESKVMGSTACVVVQNHTVRQYYEAQFEAAQKLKELVLTDGWDLTDWGCPRSLRIPRAEYYQSDPLSTATCANIIDPPVRSPGLVARVTVLCTTITVLATVLVYHARRMTCRNKIPSTPTHVRMRVKP